MAISQRWTVIGIFADQNTARQAITALQQAGFTDEQIGFVVRNGGLPQTGISTAEEGQISGEGTGVMAGGIIGGVLGAANALLIPVLGPDVASTIPETGLPLAEEAVDHLQHKGDIPHLEEPSAEGENAEASVDEMAAPVQENEMVEEERHTRRDVGEGAFAGGIVGGILGAVASLAFPVIGPIFAGGVLITVLGGAALGAVTGGFLGAFVRMGVPEEHAQSYENEFKAGRTIVTVKTEDRQQEALDILNANHALYANAHERV